MNKELLLKVKEAILREPENFRMDRWLHKRQPNDPTCNTTACIGGWAVVLHENSTPVAEYYKRAEVDFVFGEKVEPLATEFLGLDYEQKERLFYDENWPWEFESRFRDAERDKNKTLMAQIAAERIDHFIATNGEE